MTNQEAQFRLGACRPGGADASDPAMAEAFAQARRDPGLAAWQAREQAFDTAVAAKLGELAPPPGLREAILSGVRANPRRRPTAFAPWLAAAAAVAVLAGAGAYLLPRLRPAAPPVSVAVAPVVPAVPAPPILPAAAAADPLVATALGDVRLEEHEGLPEVQHALADRLGDPNLVLAGPLPVDVPQLRSVGCRSIRAGGREVFEMCFMRQGSTLHLYVAVRGKENPARGLALASQGPLVAATWSDARFDYVLVGATGQKEMLRLMRAT